MTESQPQTPLVREREMDHYRVNPNPRLVALLNFALAEVISKLHGPKYAAWIEWAQAWDNGERQPGRCVDIAHKCFAHKIPGLNGERIDPLWHTLGQLAWGAKEACYTTPTSGWLVIRYIADAMTAFGIAFPENLLLRLSPPIEDAATEVIRKET